MRVAILAGVLMAFCVAGNAEAQTAYGKWAAGKSSEGYDVVRTAATEGSRAILDVFCPSGGASVRIQLNKGIGTVSDEQVRVKLDFDDSGEPPTSWAHRYSPNNSMLTLSRGRVSQFVAHAKGAAQLKVRVTDPQNVAPIDLAFSLEGFPEALAALPCGKGL